jgi:hypothetical protein
MPTVQPEWVQYGSFGLIAFLVIVGLPGGFFGLWRAVQKAFDYHKQMIDEAHASHERTVQCLTLAFTQETERCREGQEKQAQRAEAKDEKDRQLRHDLTNSIQMLNGQIDMMMAGKRA